MVRLRLDRRLQGRLDACDVLQEAFLDVQRKAADFAAKSDLSGYLWLRLVTPERLLILHRHHLGAQMCDSGQEVSLVQGGPPAATTHSLANLLLGRLTSPSQAAIRAERPMRLQEALNSMDAIDREVLALRHFERIEQPRRRGRPWSVEDRRQQPIPPGPQTAQGDPRRPAGAQPEPVVAVNRSEVRASAEGRDRSRGKMEPIPKDERNPSANDATAARFAGHGVI